MNKIQPNNERKYRLECLSLALGAANPDDNVEAIEIIQKAETFYRYVIDGTSPATVVKMVSK